MKRQDAFAPHDWMRGKYIVTGKLGEGGFGKVRKAIHSVTNDTVAIKEMNKKKLGRDIHHIRKEVEAMKNLCHQNICRLLQFVETETDFYLVLEYCNGGEMFDYIVQKAKLSEPEARHFFRQLVQAMAFCHSQGFAHRDLKPENLLLKEDLRLKVIDFGLSSRTGHNLSTFCGSLCYAAPEILEVSPLYSLITVVQNRPYDGKAADIWSMGVLLYILVTGNSPFNSENQQHVIRCIKNGEYQIPSFVSRDCQMLLRKMMEKDPKMRISMLGILNHPWVKQGYSHALKCNSVYNKDIVDEDIIREMAAFEGDTKDIMAQKIRQWRFDYDTATYLLLLERKERRESILLPDYKKKGGNVVNSPTIHASLESGLDTNNGSYPERPFTPGPFTRSPYNPTEHRPRIRATDYAKENIPAPPPRNDQYYGTPKRTVKPAFITPKRTGSLPRGSAHESPAASPKQSPKTCRESRSATKSPKFGRRLFASLERMKAPRVLDMITPKRHNPESLKKCTNYANVSVTYSETPEPIVERLVEALRRLDLDVTRNGYKVSGTHPKGDASVELEVVFIEEMNKCGVKRKRITGNGFCYKRICEEVLNMARLAEATDI